MKEKILSALKTKYSNLGLSAEILTAQAQTLATLGFVTDENMNTVVDGLELSLKAIQTASDKDRTAKAKAEAEKAALELKLGEKKDEKKDEPQDVAKIVADAIKAFSDSQNLAKIAEQEKQARMEMIASKVKELSIPEWRVNEGFAISDTMDDAGITSYLTGIKSNITTAGLEGSKGFPMDLSNTDKNKEIAKEIVEKIKF